MQAVSQGIIDRSAGEYVNPRTGDAVAIETAMGDGRILVDHVTTTRTPEKFHSIGLMTIRTETEMMEYDITAAMDTRTGHLLSTDQARLNTLFHFQQAYLTTSRLPFHYLRA